MEMEMEMEMEMAMGMVMAYGDAIESSWKGVFILDIVIGRGHLVVSTTVVSLATLLLLM